ncbi:uncharacterized protein PFLUO_LOCUS4650 [Penicillium psychrofluorescens]|uniref:uncharacterized protein n=1 Tax=Penicillium psychrofluorescens TaxID=3158075 RepID=UPI003CCD9DFF
MPLRRMTPLQQWLQLRRGLGSTTSVLYPPHASNPLSPVERLLALSNQHSKPTSSRTTKRPFHHTRPALRKGPKPSPRVDDAQWQQKRQRSAEFLDNNRWINWKDYDLKLAEVRYEAESLYKSATEAGMLPKSLKLKDFIDIGVKLLEASTKSTGPTKQAIRSISQDVDTVHKIGHIHSNSSKLWQAWLLRASANAEAKAAVVILAAQQARNQKVVQRTPYTDLVTTFARQDRYPPAMLLEAHFLQRLGKNQEARDLLDKEIFPYLQPTAIQPPLWEDITLGRNIQSPWTLLATITAQLQLHEMTDQILETAAIKYQDSDALVKYAAVLWQRGEQDKYEECMNKAAMAGNPDACFRLANYYYKISEHVYDPRSERTWESPATNPVERFLQKLFRPLQERIRQKIDPFIHRETYAKLATEWYEVATELNSSNRVPALMAAILHRRVHNWRAAQYFIDLQGDDPLLARKMGLMSLRDGWEDPTYEPDIKSSMLPVP